MATNLFITVEDVKLRTNMGGNVDSDKYVQSIYHVQQTQLLPIIGQDLYDRIDTELDGTPSAAITTLLGGSMRDVIANYAASDYALLSNYTMDNGSTSSYTPSNGFTVSTDEVIRLTERLEDKAKFYGQQLIQFLKDNNSDYPEWEGSDTMSNYFGWVMGDGGTCW